LTVRAIQIERELRALCRGRGVQANDLADRLGPALRTVCSVEGDDDATARLNLIECLDAALEALPDDLRAAAAAALAIRQETRDQKVLNDRVTWLTGHLRVSDRTVRRRIDDALHRLAGEVVANFERKRRAQMDPDRGWYISRFKTLLVLDQSVPFALEEREIVPTIDNLTEIIHRTSIPRDLQADDLTLDVYVELQYGGSLRPHRSSGSLFEYVLTLPRPLHKGERHEYAVRVRIPPGQPMVPHYICVPVRRHDSFELRIRFDPAEPPVKVWRVAGAVGREIDDARATNELLRPDRFGEVHATFTDLRMGFGYGIQWIASR